MRLADEIEQWGITHAERLDTDERDLLRRIWSVVRRSDDADLDILDLTHDDGSRVIELFEGPERNRVASTLNAIVTNGRRRARDEIDLRNDDEAWDDEDWDDDEWDDFDEILVQGPAELDDQTETASVGERRPRPAPPERPVAAAADDRGPYFFVWLVLAIIVLGAALGVGLWFFVA